MLPRPLFQQSLPPRSWARTTFSAEETSPPRSYEELLEEEKGEKEKEKSTNEADIFFAVFRSEGQFPSPPSSSPFPFIPSGHPLLPV